MRIHFHLAHPAHFHLFKNVAQNLLSIGEEVIFTYNDKDVLEDLINNSSFKDISVKLKSRKQIRNRVDLILQFIEKNYSLYKILKSRKPNLVLGTSIIISLTGKLLRIPNVIVNEDDFDIIEQTANLGYRFADKIICPEVCRTGKWDYKSVKYSSYHELAYLHPNHFTPDKDIVEKYTDSSKPFFLMRFAKLSAHHDKDIEGINDQMALKIIDILEKQGNVYITTERDIGEKLNKYRMHINPIDMHHVLAYTKLYIGDSQTMAAEAGVLGTPFIRINDFVGRISYLDELEKKYKLGYGVKPAQAGEIFNIVEEILSYTDVKEWQNRRNIMLRDKLDFTDYLSNFIQNYNQS